MIQSLQELDALFRDTPLANHRIAAARVPESAATVFALEVGTDALTCWEYARAMLGETGRWPVLTTLAFARESESWPRQVAEADLFSRHEFAQECRDTRRDDSPAAIIAAADGLDVELLCGELPQEEAPPIEECIGPELNETAALFGTAPQAEDAMAFLAASGSADLLDLDRWCFEWELAHCAEPLTLPIHGLHHLEWHTPSHDTQALLLMPGANGYETPAYLNWFGACRGNSQFIVALLREWQQRYGAELVAHYGTMLHFLVQRRPHSVADAYRLAWQQAAVAPDTLALPGVALRNHARALLQTDRWFLKQCL
jgi:hypothetical protein